MFLTLKESFMSFLNIFNPEWWKKIDLSKEEHDRRSTFLMFELILGFLVLFSSLPYFYRFFNGTLNQDSFLAAFFTSNLYLLLGVMFLDFINVFFFFRKRKIKILNSLFDRVKKSISKAEKKYQQSRYEQKLIPKELKNGLNDIYGGLIKKEENRLINYILLKMSKTYGRIVFIVTDEEIELSPKVKKIYKKFIYEKYGYKPKYFIKIDSYDFFEYAGSLLKYLEDKTGGQLKKAKILNVCINEKLYVKTDDRYKRIMSEIIL